MSFCQHYFQKEIDDVTFPDVRSLILNKPDLESMHLECKSWKNRGLKDFRREVKQIIGFLNIDGGLLILGTPEEKPLDPSDPTKGRIFQESFCCHSPIPKDQLRDILISRIDPLPMGIQIRSIENDEEENRYITLVDVPRGEYPPYQAGGTYYVRLEGSTSPASNAIVEALFNRVKPRYQQAIVDHFSRKIIKFRNNQDTMTALYYLILEHRSVPEPNIIAAVFRSDRVNVEPNPANMLRRDLDELAGNLGILVCQEKKEKRTFYGAPWHGYKEYSINADYQGVLADLIFEVHREVPFFIHYD